MKTLAKNNAAKKPNIATVEQGLAAVKAADAKTAPKAPKIKNNAGKKPVKPILMHTSMEPVIFNEDPELQFASIDAAAKHFKVNRNTIYYWVSGRIKNRMTIARKKGVYSARKVKDAHLIQANKKMIQTIRDKLEIESKPKPVKKVIFHMEDGRSLVFANRSVASKFFKVSRQAMHQWETTGLPPERKIKSVEWNRSL